MEPLGNKVGVCHGSNLDPWKEHAYQDKAKAKTRGNIMPCESPSLRYLKRIFAALLGKILAPTIIVAKNSRE